MTRRSHRLALAALVAAAPLAAQRALLDTLPPDARVGAHSFVGFGNELERWVLPGDGMVFGFGRAGDRLWIARGGKLHCVQWPSRRELRTVDAPAELVAICAGERFVYGVAGRTLHVLDPVAGTSMRSVAIDTVWPPSAITMHRGKLHALIDKTVAAVDTATGAVQPLMQVQERAHWIAGDGARLWCGDSFGLRSFAGDALPVPKAEPGAAIATWAATAWPCQVRESAAVWIDGRLLVALELANTKAPVREAGMLSPAGVAPAERLVLAIGVDAGTAVWTLDHEPLDGDQELAAALRRRATAPPADGTPQAQPAVVIEAEDDVTVRDVAKAWDLAAAAGFKSVRCPPLEAWVQRQQQQQQRAKPAAEPTK